MDRAHDVQSELRGPAIRLRRAIPDVLAGYASLHEAAMADGVVSAATKELVALAIAVTRECDGCVAAHARGAAKHGVTEAEVAEVMGVAILMNGGPGTVWGPRALSAFLEYAETATPAAPE